MDGKEGRMREEDVRLGCDEGVVLDPRVGAKACRGGRDGGGGGTGKDIFDIIRFWKSSYLLLRWSSGSAFRAIPRA